MFVCMCMCIKSYLMDSSYVVLNVGPDCMVHFHFVFIVCSRTLSCMLHVMCGVVCRLCSMLCCVSGANIWLGVEPIPAPAATAPPSLARSRYHGANLRPRSRQAAKRRAKRGGQETRPGAGGVLESRKLNIMIRSTSHHQHCLGLVSSRQQPG